MIGEKAFPVVTIKCTQLLFVSRTLYSLQATWIRNSILHALRATSNSSTREIPINFVYNNPTVSRLASFVYAVTNSGYSRTGDRSAAVQAMQDMLNKYTHRFSLHAPADEREDFPTGDVALLTGSTGSLGSALLTQLVAKPEVTKIYALNRKGSTTLRERQGDVLSDRGYDADEIIGSSKVVLLEADLTQSTFGLLDTTYKEVSISLSVCGVSLNSLLDTRVRDSYHTQRYESCRCPLGMHQLMHKI